MKIIHWFSTSPFNAPEEHLESISKVREIALFGKFYFHLVPFFLLLTTPRLSKQEIRLRQKFKTIHSEFQS